jgi:hypothetical protein
MEEIACVASATGNEYISVLEVQETCRACARGITTCMTSKLPECHLPCARCVYESRLTLKAPCHKAQATDLAVDSLRARALLHLRPEVELELQLVAGYQLLLPDVQERFAFH